MTLSMWIPLDAYVSGWPDNLFPRPDLTRLAVIDHTTRVAGGVNTSVLRVRILADLTLALPGIDVITLQLLPGTYGSELTVEVDWTGAFAVRVVDLGADLVIASPLLVPVTGGPGSWTPQLQSDGTPEPMRIALAAGQVALDGFGGITVSSDGRLTVPAFAIGDTGFVVEITDARLSFSGENPPPDTAVQGFRGLLFDSATLYLPDGLDLPGVVPESIAILDGAIGTGGFSGAFVGTWNVTWDGSTPSGDGAGTLLGFAFGLESLVFQVEQDAVIAAALLGRLAVPFFDQVLTVAVALDNTGGFAVTVTGTPDNPPLPAAGTDTTATTPAIATLALPGLGTLTVTSLGVVRDDEGEALLLSGCLDLTAGELTWPTITVHDLRIGVDGRVQVPGGWVDLPEPIALDLYGFGVEITRIGFGTEDDGRRWVGMDGAIRFTELLPAGASARGLRVLWDPADPQSPPTLALDGIGVEFGVPGAFSFAGEVALTEDPLTGAKLFTGGLGLALDALDVGVDVGITIGRLAPLTYVFVHLGVAVPIPLGATGAALYGLEGLFALNMSPVVTNGPWPDSDDPAVARGDWYGWYKQVPPEFTATDPLKWSADPGAWALGAGISVGTLPDAGFAVNTRALLAVLLPGPVILLKGTADLFKAPPQLGGSEQEGTLSMLAALDGRAGTLQLGIDAAWSLARVIDIAASTEAYFDFDRPDAWHLWIGQDIPEQARIRADLLALFHADSWLMLDARGVSTGLAVQFGDSWRFGPVGLALESWISGRADLTTRPPQLTGSLRIGGTMAIEVGPFGLGLSVEAALAGSSFTSYEVSGTLSVVVELPSPLKDLDVDVSLSWREPAVPVIEDPWVSALVDHARTTESWIVTEGGTINDEPAAAPVVPLDAGIVLTFAKAMGDLTAVADNPPPATPITTVGDHQASYTVTELRLYRWRRSRPDLKWDDVTGTVFGTWTPDAGGAGSRLQLFTRSPFAFTRFTSRRWIDGFTDAVPHWPCLPEPEIPATCVDWTDRRVGAALPMVWDQAGATFVQGGDVRIGELDAASVLRLGLSTADHTVHPGKLWIRLPEPVADVTATVDVPIGDALVLTGRFGDAVVDVAARSGSAGPLRVTGERIDAVALDWAFSAESSVISLCWTPAEAVEAHDGWTDRKYRLESSVSRWESEEQLLDPDSHYLLQVRTSVLLTRDGAEVQRTENVHAVQFQTGGPPGIAPAWLTPPDQVPATAFPFGGVLADLRPYVARSVPDPGAAPVFRGYDLACEFVTSTVAQQYGADLRIAVRDDSGTPILIDLAWDEAAHTLLSTPDAAWLAALASCTGAVDPATVRGNDVLTAALPTDVVLPPRRGLTAVVEGTRPLYTDPFDDLTGFDALALATGAPVTTCTATGGSATLSRPKHLAGGVVALVRDLGPQECTIAATAQPSGDGTFGLVVGHAGPGDYLGLTLTVGGGRRLVAHASAGELGTVRTVWQDPTPVVAGRAYALSLSYCDGTAVVGIDGVEVPVAVTLPVGRIGLLSDILTPAGCSFSDLVVRSAPYRTVHSWRFTTSAYAGLPELFATFDGRVWPAEGAVVDRAELSRQADLAASALAESGAVVESARAELAAAAAASNLSDIPALGAVAVAAVDADLAASAAAHDALAVAAGLPYRPGPPVVEVLSVTDGADVVALILDLPEPLPRERVVCTVTHVGAGTVHDVVVAWREDGATALVVRASGAPFESGRWRLGLTLNLDVGAERVVWHRGGSSAPESAILTFHLP